MRALNLKQTDMLSAQYLFDINPLNKYHLLFKNLDSTPFNTTPEAARGRNPIPKFSLLRALIYKNLKALPTVSDLVTNLNDNPSIAIKCGFHPKQKNPNNHEVSHRYQRPSMRYNNLRNILEKSKFSSLGKMMNYTQTKRALYMPEGVLPFGASSTSNVPLKPSLRVLLYPT